MLRVFFYIGFTCLFNVSILKSMCILIGWWQEGARNSIIWRALDVLMSVKWLLSFFCLVFHLGLRWLGFSIRGLLICLPLCKPIEVSCWTWKFEIYYLHRSVKSSMKRNQMCSYYQVSTMFEKKDVNLKNDTW